MSRGRGRILIKPPSNNGQKGGARIERLSVVMGAQGGMQPSPLLLLLEHAAGVNGGGGGQGSARFTVQESW